MPDCNPQIVIDTRTINATGAIVDVDVDVVSLPSKFPPHRTDGIY